VNLTFFVAAVGPVTSVTNAFQVEVVALSNAIDVVDWLEGGRVIFRNRLFNPEECYVIMRV
jgi:hypothetical protein